MYVGSNSTQVYICIRRSDNHFDMNLDRKVVCVCSYVRIVAFLVVDTCSLVSFIGV
jgi:hypothetical protein